MQINKIDQNNTNFKAKFLHTKDLEKVVEWACEHNKFDKLNTARNNIDRGYLRHRIRFELFTTTDGKPYVIMTRFTPKKHVRTPKTYADFNESEPMIFQSHVKMNMFRYGYEKIIQLGNDAPHNNMYKRVVVRGGDKT